MTEFTHMFPATWSDQEGQFVVSAMTSVAYGPLCGDPSPMEIRIPEDFNQHHIAEWFKTNDHDGAMTQVLGTDDHSPIGNKPTQLVIFFFNQNDRAKFIAEMAL
jgi:hypothetical protein